MAVWHVSFRSGSLTTAIRMRWELCAGWRLDFNCKTVRTMTDSTTRFSTRAQSYAAFRPSYPPGAIDAALEGLGDPHGLTIADVGAGTGISARLFAERGAAVIAIEPNAADARRSRTASARLLARRDGAERLASTTRASTP